MPHTFLAELISIYINYVLLLWGNQKTVNMNYKGNLYGYIGTGFFFTGKTSDDWDTMEAELIELRAKVNAATDLKQRNPGRILCDLDLKTYMTKREMYATKEVVNSNFKTEFEANRTYFIEGIDIEWVTEDTVICYIFSGGIECSFHRTTTKNEFYTEMKKLFIPISEMYEVWKSS